VQRSALCRSRRELSNEYLLAKIGVDTAENEPLEVWGKIFNIIHWVSLGINHFEAQEYRILKKCSVRPGRELEILAVQQS